MKRPRVGASAVGTVGWVLLAFGILFGADTWLARTQKAESAAEAARLFRQGQNLMNLGHSSDAIEAFRDALVVDRGNPEYRRALALAQLLGGRDEDARSTLLESLQTDSTDAAANLLLARVLVKEGLFADAVSYFHRAIYGQWGKDAPGNRLRARFELIDLLAQHGSHAELLAELLPVEDEARSDLPQRIRIGRLFLTAGSPARAAGVFQDILTHAPSSVDANAGLGEAELAQGLYREAQKHFEYAVRLAPGNTQIRQRLDLCERATLLDPSVRGLGSAERLRRSLRLLETTAEQMRACAGDKPTEHLTELLALASRAQQTRPRRSLETEAAESNVALAGQIWHAANCKSPGDEALILVLTRLER